MSIQQEYKWRGVGRWLSFAIAAAMILLSVPHILTNVAAGGWNLFLGLLLFGAIASGNKHAPTLAAVLAILCAVRAVLGLILETDVVGALVETAFGIVVAIAARDLHRQKRAASLA